MQKEDLRQKISKMKMAIAALTTSGTPNEMFVTEESEAEVFLSS